jgi:hypothetical protein
VGGLRGGFYRVVDTQQVVQSSGKPAARGRLAEVAALFASSADFATGMPLDTTFRITGAPLRLAAMLLLPDSDRVRRALAGLTEAAHMRCASRMGQGVWCRGRPTTPA